MAEDAGRLVRVTGTEGDVRFYTVSQWLVGEIWRLLAPAVHAITTDANFTAYTKQVANLIINEGKTMSKKHGKPISELIEPDDVGLISHLIVGGAMTKLRGRKLFCEVCDMTGKGL